MKTPEELKKDLEDAETAARNRRPDTTLTIGDPAGTRATRSAFRAAWDRLHGITREIDLPAQEVVSAAKHEDSVEVLDTRRTFYDTSKGLVAVYERTPNVVLPIFKRGPDGHLGAVGE